MACPARCADLIGQIVTAHNDERPHNAFDVLRIPSYFDFPRYRQRIEEIHNLLSAERCSCNGRLTALAWANQAWSNINSAPALSTYTTTLRNTIPPVISAENVPLAINRPTITEPSIRDPFPRRGQSFQGPLEYVQGDRRLRWRMMDWTHANMHPYPVHIENTFWTALSLALRGSADYWAEVKSAMNSYFTSVTADLNHPRNAAYRVLNAEIVRLSNLLNNAYNPAPLSTQLAATTFATASRELWQVTTDAFHIELLLIIIAPQVRGTALSELDTPHDISGGVSPVIPRGDHNARQIFLAVDASLGFPRWIYAAVEPDRRDNAAWRYVSHLPPQLASTSSLENSVRRRADKERAGWRRCPLAEAGEFNGDGQAIGSAGRLMRGAEEVLGSAPGSVGPLERVVDDKYIASSEAEETLRYWNCGFPL